MNPTNLFDYYKNQGQSLPSLQERAKIASQAGISGYSGTPEQNKQLLSYLSKGNSVSNDTMGSPSGRFEGLSNSQIAQVDKTLTDSGVFNGSTGQGIQPGESGQAYANRVAATPFEMANYSGGSSVPEPIIQEGIFKGMTQSQANKKKEQQIAQDSQLTSYSFNPESIAKSAEASNKFNLSLNEITNSPFESNQTKEQKKNTLLDITAFDIAKSFTNPQDFYTTYQNNPELQKSLQPFISNGGSLATVASKISTPVNVNNQPKDTATYLSDLNKKTPTNQFEQQALEALSLENKLAQDEISRQVGIPQQYKDLYFGTSEKIGILQEQKKLAEEKKKLLEQKELNDKTTIRERAQYQIDKNNSDAEIAKAEIEENRLKAKNYMTNTLAKLGALQTSGTAPLALATLEQKYQKEKIALDTKLKFANREVEIGMTEKINNITETIQEKILGVQEDLSKSSSDVLKEVFNLQKTADSQIYNIMTSAASKLRTQTEKYKDEAQSIADKYNSNFMLLAGKGLNLKSIPGMIDAQGRIITSKVPASAFAKEGGNVGGFTDQELRKLEQAGIDPKTQRKQALDLLYGQNSSQDIVPKYKYGKGEQLLLPKKKDTGLKIATTLADNFGVDSTQLSKLQNYLNIGYSLDQLKTKTNMPDDLYYYLKENVTTPE